MKDITDYLYSLRGRGAKLGLGRMQRLAEALGNPQEEMKIILVGGTSGKGSTVAMLSSILTEAGFKTGRFTSPHLSSLTERISIDGNEISEEELTRVVNKIRETIKGMKADDNFEHPTFFEVITAAALIHFKEQKADFAVLEVGLGGRLDATNITSPIVSIITDISLEHTRILGDSVEKIAEEKGGIIKENGILVTAAHEKAFGVLERICKERNCRLADLPDVDFRGADAGWQMFDAGMPGMSFGYQRIPLLGRHQLQNAACVLGAVYALMGLGYDIPQQSMRRGFRNVKWPGRVEIVNEKPIVVLDCAKDPAAMKRLAETMKENFKFKKLITVLGISKDKDIKKMVDEIVPISDFFVATKHKVMERSAEPEAIAAEVKKHKKGCKIVSDVKGAVKEAIALAGEEDAVLVTGSLFTVGEARELWHSSGNAILGRELNEIPKK